MNKFFNLILSILLIFSATGCTQVNNSPVENNKIKIVTTIFPLYEFASEITKDRAEVTLLLPPGVEPHAYEPTPQDIKTILDSDIFFYVGENLEPWANDILEGSNFQGKIVEASKAVTLIENDPHIWLNLENDIKIIDYLLTYLTDNIDIKYFEMNSNLYKEKLKILDQKYETTLDNCETKSFITGGHNAYSYLAKRYNLTFYSASNLSADSEPTPQRIKEISDIAKEKDIKYILSEELINKDMSEAIANEVGAKILLFNPAGNISKEDYNNNVTFLEIMEKNLEILNQTLNCHE